MLYDLRWWEIQAILRGYDRRCRQQWSMTRWHAYSIMSAIPYCDLKKSGIYRPSDLITFPWEKETELANPPTEDEIAQLQAEMAAMNSSVATPSQP